MSYSKLSILKPGQTFRVGECLCILLEHGKGEFEGAAKVLAVEVAWAEQPVMMEQPFDKHESNYKLSELRRDIESEVQEWIEDQIGVDNLVEHTVSLTTVDGQDDYGELTCKVRPLTFDEARKYNNLVSDPDSDGDYNEGYWTCTAWSVPRRTGYETGNSVAYVTYNGMIERTEPHWGCDVRLVCILKSDIEVWID